MTNNISKLIELTKKLQLINKEYKDFWWHLLYLNWIKDEIQEVKDELKPNNTVYLEDELWDILRDYINLVITLEVEWLITDSHKVFEKAWTKYSERTDDGKEYTVKRRNKIKTKQKELLKKQHHKKYN